MRKKKKNSGGFSFDAEDKAGGEVIEPEQEAPIQIETPEEPQAQEVREAPAPRPGTVRVRMNHDGKVLTTNLRRAQILVNRGRATFVR